MSLQNLPIPMGKAGTVVAVAEQEEIAVCRRFWVRAALQNTALMVLWLVEMKAVAELSLVQI